MDKARMNRSRSWMMRADNLALVRECRKLVQKEFGETLHIDDAQLLEKLCDFAARSRDGTLRRLVLPIERLLRHGHVSREITELDLSGLSAPTRLMH